MTERRCLTPEEYATERKVSVRTVYRLIKAGKVPAERVGWQWRIWLRPGQPATTPPESSPS